MKLFHSALAALLCLSGTACTTYVPVYPNLQPLPLAPEIGWRPWTQEEIFGDDNTRPEDMMLVRRDWVSGAGSSLGRYRISEGALRQMITEYNSKVVGFINSKHDEYAADYDSEKMKDDRNWVRNHSAVKDQVPSVSLPSQPGDRP